MRLPLVTSIAHADLALTSIATEPARKIFRAAEPVELRVTVANLGPGRAAPFWVDLVIEPAVPLGPNRPWNSACRLLPCHGIAWAVDAGLAAGESVTLSSATGSYDPAFASWNGKMPPGTTTLMAYADSFSPNGTASASGDALRDNNLAVLGGISVVAEQQRSQ